MIEKVARAISGLYGLEFDRCAADRKELRQWAAGGICDYNTPTQEDHLQAARAALSALRDPTAGMFEAAGGEEINMERFDDPTCYVRDIWQAMLDHALTEEGA